MLKCFYSFVIVVLLLSLQIISLDAAPTRQHKANHVPVEYDNFNDVVCQTVDNSRTKRSSINQLRRWNLRKLTYFIDTTNLKSLKTSIAGWIIGNAMNQWANASGLTIVETSNIDEANITFQWLFGDHDDGQPFDGQGGVLAHAFYPTSFTRKGQIHLDAGEVWSAFAVTGTASLPHLVLHEIGHALGLEHSTDNQAVMYPYFPGFAKRRDPILTQADRDAIANLYRNIVNDFDYIEYNNSLVGKSPETSAICGEIGEKSIKGVIHLHFNSHNNTSYYITNNDTMLRLNGFRKNVVEFFPGEPARYGASSFLTIDFGDYTNLYIFQNSLYWKYKIYPSSKKLQGNWPAVDGYRIVEDNVNPDLISNGFDGISVSSPIVFKQVINGSLVIFFIEVHQPNSSSIITNFWGYNYGEHKAARVNSTKYPFLAALPVPVFDLNSIIEDVGGLVAIAKNGSIWRWRNEVAQIEFDDEQFNSEYNLVSSEVPRWNPSGTVSSLVVDC